MSDVQIDPKKEKKDRNKEKRAKKKAALIRILDYVKTNSSDDQLLADVKFLTPGQRFGGEVRTGIMDVAYAVFREKRVLTEAEAFEAFKMGRPGMRSICKKLIRKQKPENRLWIYFDAQEGTYSVKGEGADSPEGWTGYKPLKVEDMEIV